MEFYVDTVGILVAKDKISPSNGTVFMPLAIQGIGSFILYSATCTSPDIYHDIVVMTALTIFVAI